MNKQELQNLIFDNDSRPEHERKLVKAGSYRKSLVLPVRVETKDDRTYQNKPIKRTVLIVQSIDFDRDGTAKYGNEYAVSARQVEWSWATLGALRDEITGHQRTLDAWKTLLYNSPWSPNPDDFISAPSFKEQNAALDNLREAISEAVRQANLIDSDTSFGVGLDQTLNQVRLVITMNLEEVADLLNKVAVA